MISKNILFFIGIPTLLLLVSCQKEIQTTNPSKIITVDNTISIYDLLVIDDTTLLAAGGKRNTIGKIFLSEDGGETWTKTWESPFCIYTLYAKDDTTIFAGGDSITVLKTTDRGNTWVSLIHYTFTNWQGFVTPVQSICFMDSDTGFAVGGDNQQKGILCFTSNGGKNWKFQDFSNEFHSVVFDNQKNGYMLGYGKVLKTIDHGSHWQDNEFTGDNLKTAVVQNQTVWACGYRGNIYNNEAGQWHPVFSVSVWNNQIHWQDIISTQNNNLLTVGNNGMLWFQNTNNLTEITNAPDFLSVAEVRPNVFYAGTNDGRIFVFSESR